MLVCRCPSVTVCRDSVSHCHQMSHVECVDAHVAGTKLTQQVLWQRPQLSVCGQVFITLHSDKNQSFLQRLS